MSGDGKTDYFHNTTMLIWGQEQETDQITPFHIIKSMAISNMSIYASKQKQKNGTENLYWLGMYDKITRSTIKITVL